MYIPNDKIAIFAVLDFVIDVCIFGIGYYIGSM